MEFGKVGDVKAQVGCDDAQCSHALLLVEGNVGHVGVIHIDEQGNVFCVVVLQIVVVGGYCVAIFAVDEVEVFVYATVFRERFKAKSFCEAYQKDKVKIVVVFFLFVKPKQRFFYKFIYLALVLLSQSVVYSFGQKRGDYDFLRLSIDSGVGV